MCQSGLTIKGNEFISPGAPVQMRVVSYEKRKIAGKPAKVSLQAVSVTAVDGTQVQLRGGDFAAEGKNKAAVAIGLCLFLFIPAILIKGGDAEIAPGTTVDAFIANDVEIEVDWPTNSKKEALVASFFLQKPVCVFCDKGYDSTCDLNQSFRILLGQGDLSSVCWVHM